MWNLWDGGVALPRKMAAWLRRKLDEAARGGRGRVVLSLAGHAEDFEFYPKKS